jgi:hypothetical protein
MIAVKQLRFMRVHEDEVRGFLGHKSSNAGERRVDFRGLPNYAVIAFFLVYTYT